MATQLKQTDFAPQAAPRPNIRVVFSAGPAALAMREKLAEVPGADSTLDELALQAMARNLIRMARDHLSLALHDAFLRWCEASIMFNTETDSDTDDEINAQASRHGDALHALEEAKAETISDMCLKSYVAMVEASERGGVIGPIDQTNRERLGFAAINIGGGFANDILTLSPLTRLLNDVAAKAWSISRPSNNWLPTVGLPLVALFADASTPAAVSLREWDKAYDGYQRATAAFRDCPEEPQDEFNRVTCLSADATLHVMTTPAPTLNEFRIKVALLASTRADELGRDGEAIMAVAADARRLLPEPAADADGAWAKAKADWQSVRRDLATKGLSDEQVDVLVEREMTAFCGLTSLPLRNGDDVATRLRAMIDLFGHVPPEPLTELLEDMARLSAVQANDSVILDAFTDRRRQFIDTRNIVLTAEAEDAYFARLDGNDETLANTPAGTIAGVVAKLRVAFAQTNSDAWSDQAIGNPTGSEFREGLRLGSLYDQMLWSAIEDLARIGGVNLSEQGK